LPTFTPLDKEVPTGGADQTLAVPSTKNRADVQPENKASGSPAGGLPLPVDEPLACAKEFVSREFTTVGGAVCLRFYRGGFYRWTGTHYAEIESKEVRSKIYEFLRRAVTLQGGNLVPFKPTRAKVNSILDALEASVFQSREKNAPFWLGRLHEDSAEDLIVCQNGILKIETRSLLPHDPHLFNFNALAFDYDPDARTYPKEWMKFLRQLWPGDTGKSARRALQEIFGLMLIPDARHQKIFMIVGPKRSGKGTIARVLTALLGKENVTAPTLSGLSSHFGLSPLIDKRAAIISDARLSRRANADAIVERLLSISGEDALTIDRKYRDPWTGRLSVRFLILTNELPRIVDASGALASRFILLTLTESFYGKEDQELTARLLTELPGILNWALRGLDRLRQRGRFAMPQSSLTAIQQLEDLASPVSAFLRNCCIIDPNEIESVKAPYDAWAGWCEQHGLQAGPDHVFRRNLAALLPHLALLGRAGKQFYQGVALSSDGKKECLIA